MFYNWLYLRALAENTAIAEQLLKYDAFTDIAYNPQKSINCQARATAIFVSLANMGILQEAMGKPDNFKHVVYGKEPQLVEEQTTLF